MLLVYFKKAFPLTLLGHSFDRRTAYWLLFCFESYHGIPYSYTSKQRIVNTLLMIKINPTCNRLLIFICQEKKQKHGLYLQWAGKELLNMFFHRCNNQISCLMSWCNSSNVLVLIFASELPQKHWLYNIFIKQQKMTKTDSKWFSPFFAVLMYFLYRKT